MSNINKAAVLNPFMALVDNVIDYIPRATTSEFGIVAIGSGINIDTFGRIYLDTQEYSDRLSAIEAQAASTLATQKSEVAAAIAQVNLTQSQTITALNLEVSTLKTNLTDSITATHNELINRADQLAQDVTDITVQLTQDKATFTQDIQAALDYLKDDASVASALRHPRKINGTDFDGRSDITTNAWGATRTFKIGNKTNNINGTSNVDYSLADIGAFPEVGGTIQGSVEVTGNLSVGGTISATLEGKAASADKLHVAHKIQGVDFDGTKDISLPTFTTQADGLVPKRIGAASTKYLREDGTWVVPTDTIYPLLTAANAEGGTTTAANSISAKVLKDAILYHTPVVTNIEGNAGTATKLQTSRTIALTGGVTGSVSFDGSANASIATTVTGLGTANGIATLDSNGQVPSTQLPSFVDDVLEYVNVAAFPATGEAGKIYVETTGNTTYRWGGSGYVKITSGEVSSVAGKTGVVTLSKSDVGLANADNTADSVKSVASAAKLTTARTIGGVSFDGTTNVNLPGVNTTGNQSTTGNAATASTLQTARTINGTSFNGSANITTASWGIARTLTLGSTGKSVNGSADVSWSSDEILPTGTNGQVLKHNGTSWIAGVDNDTTYSAMTAAEATTGTATTARLITPAVLKSTITALAPVQTSIAGNAASATKLATARTIGGVSFDGTADINLPGVNTAGNQSTSGNAATASKLQTTRTISLTGGATGSTSFDGSGNAAIAVTVGDDTHNHTKLDTLAVYSKVAADLPTAWPMGVSSTFVDAAVGYPSFGGVLSVRPYSSGGGSLQIYTPYSPTHGGETLAVRFGNYNVGSGNSWTEFKYLIHDKNIANYAPTRTGEGASGTWGIAITGNASTATSAAKWTTARTLTIGDSGKSVDGSGNVSWSRLDMGVPWTTTSTSVGIDNSESCIGYISNSLLGASDGALYSHVYSDMWKHQIQGDYRTGQIALRGKNNGTWQAWRTVLDSGNYNSYSPTKTGIGASGSWGISITGNAASASALQTARTINGVSFNGTANITVADSTKLPLTGGTLTGTLTVAVGDTVGAFTKLIKGDTSTDGGYLAVGNTASDKGYVELGTIDDADTAIVVRKRNSANAVLKEAYLLDSNHNTSFPGTLTVSGAITSASNITAYSDIRIKDNITLIDDALNKVSQLKGVSYNRTDLDDKDKRYVGLIAQDVQAVMPEAVNTSNDELNTLSVDYQGLVGLLVESIKELKLEIDELKEKVK